MKRYWAPTADAQPGVSEEAVAARGAALGVALPAPLVSLYREQDGGRLVNCGVELWPMEDMRLGEGHPMQDVMGALLKAADDQPEVFTREFERLDVPLEEALPGLGAPRQAVHIGVDEWGEVISVCDTPIVVSPGSSTGAGVILDDADALPFAEWLDHLTRDDGRPPFAIGDVAASQAVYDDPGGGAERRAPFAAVARVGKTDSGIVVVQAGGTEERETRTRSLLPWPIGARLEENPTNIFCLMLWSSSTGAHDDAWSRMRGEAWQREPSREGERYSQTRLYRSSRGPLAATLIKCGEVDVEEDWV